MNLCTHFMTVLDRKLPGPEDGTFTFSKLYIIDDEKYERRKKPAQLFR